MKKIFGALTLLVICQLLGACGGGGGGVTPLVRSTTPSDSGTPSADPSTSPDSTTGPVLANLAPLYDARTTLEPIASFVRDDGVVVTRIGDRGRDRHAKDITASDHYDHYLAHYWEYRTARVQFEDYVPKGQSLIRATFITEAELGARGVSCLVLGADHHRAVPFQSSKTRAKGQPQRVRCGLSRQGNLEQ